MGVGSISDFPNGVRSFGSIITGPVGLSPIGGGKAFFVDQDNVWGFGAGSDGNEGRSPESPLASIQAAIDLCVADRGDFIYLAPSTHNVDEAVTFDKAGIVVVAANPGYPTPMRGEIATIATSAAYTDGPAAIVTQPVKAIGVGFAARDLTQESLRIDCGESGGFDGGFNEFLNCRFSAWYGAIDVAVRQIGGVGNHFIGCTFDGLFGGFATAAMQFENDVGGQAPDFTRILGCYFSGVGSGIPAVKFKTGAVPTDFLMAHNYNLDGFGTRGPLLDNNSVVSGGLIADNWTGLASKGAAFLNLTNSNLSFNDNHYEE